MRRFMHSLASGVVWGILGAMCVSGLFTFFWMLMPPARLGMEDPFANLPWFDAALLIGTPVVSFLALGAMVFWIEWTKEKRSVSVSRG
jgi:hypothetical protein